MIDPTIFQAGIPALLAALLFGYLLGSIPFGLILTRLAGKGDVRSIGSGNIGATNVLRTGSKKLAAATLILDMLKGTAAVVAVTMWGKGMVGEGPPLLGLALAAGFGAFLGHLYPVWLGFKGGKGVATFEGLLLGLLWPLALVFAVVWLAVAFLSRYSSLAALVASVVATVAAYFVHDRGALELGLVLTVMTILIFIKHRANISRLLNGTEGKIGAKG
jgi:acyl phosphate:glycerol-3-phosphate acyltransferase